MVYVFTYLANYTDQTWKVENTGNHQDDYMVGPRKKTKSVWHPAVGGQDACLCTNEDGGKGVSLYTNMYGMYLSMVGWLVVTSAGQGGH